MGLTGVLSVVLGAEFDRLPKQLQTFHRDHGHGPHVGKVTVTQGSWIARLLCRLGGFPTPMNNRLMRMSITHADGVEHWHRDFDGQILSSTMRQVSPEHVAERFGPFEVQMQPACVSDGLDMPVTAIKAFGLPVPNLLFRGSGGQETVTDDGQISFVVTSYLLGLGCLIEYRGTLAPDVHLHQSTG